jgi:putative hydrolase of the HAD superfamily
LIEAVIFDLDGVLVHSGVFGTQLSRELRLERADLDMFWHGPFSSCALGRADLKQEVAPFLQKWGYPGTVEDCLQAWFEADSVVNAELLGHVGGLRRQGIACHVASTQERYRAAYLRGPMGLAAHFDRLFFSCELGTKKPQPEFYQRVTAELAKNPASLLFIDDQVANVDAARAAGWNAECFAHGDDIGLLLARHGVPQGSAPAR